MTYTEAGNSVTRQSLAVNYWYIEEEQGIYNRDGIMPDSYANLIINCGAPLLWEPTPGQQVRLPQVFVIGLHTQPLSLRATGLCQLIGFQAHSWSLRTFVDGNVLLHRHSLLEANDRWHVFARGLRHTLQHRGYREAIASSQQYIHDRFPHFPGTPHAIQRAGMSLYAQGGQQRIADLAADCALSLSQFERQFKQWIGVAPKTLARLIRFEQARDRLVLDPSTNIHDLVHHLGYTDQAHLIHEFKAFSAWTPHAFAGVVRTRRAEDQHADFLQYS